MSLDDNKVPGTFQNTISCGPHSHRGCGCFYLFCWRRNGPGVLVDLTQVAPASRAYPRASLRTQTLPETGPRTSFTKAQTLSSPQPFGGCLGVGPGPRSHFTTFLAGASLKPHCGLSCRCKAGCVCLLRPRPGGEQACLLGERGCAICQRELLAATKCGVMARWPCGHSNRLGHLRQHPFLHRVGSQILAHSGTSFVPPLLLICHWETLMTGK